MLSGARGRLEFVVQVPLYSVGCHFLFMEHIKLDPMELLLVRYVSKIRQIEMECAIRKTVHRYLPQVETPQTTRFVDTKPLGLRVVLS